MNPLCCRARLLTLRGLAWLVMLAAPLAQAAAELVSWEIKVEGVTRTALVHQPPQAKTTATPLIFIFHGHGGSAGQAARSFHLERAWPEALCVYPQGLPTPGQISDAEGKRAGWQARANAPGNRDLLFFDALLARAKQEAKVDTTRIYATGHSNGGSFTYLLWLTRGEVLAAVAPSSAAAFYAPRLPPKPALLLGGRNDALVKFAWQERTATAIREANGCAPTGEPWEQAGTLYPSTSGTPLVICFSDRTHQFDTAREPALIAAFFQKQSLPQPPAPK